MYTEGFEELEEFEQTPRRAYVSNMSQEDTNRVMRENERLKEALEKERFFNKLLDQEIQELKVNHGVPPTQRSDYWYGTRGVSKGAFYTLLFITLAMGAYIGYGLYADKQFNYLKEFNPVSNGATTPSEESGKNLVTPPAAAVDKTAEPQAAADDNSSSNRDVSGNANADEADKKPVVKDSVPNIIARSQEIMRSALRTKEEAAAKATAEEKQAAAAQQPPKPAERDVETVTQSAPAPVDTRPVIARYRVTSKANFYNDANENALRNTFISSGNDKIVGALEDKNGFIYVEYTNDLGYTSRGWLSKKDLTKLQ
jgi:serine/threonine-protein kinase